MKLSELKTGESGVIVKVSGHGGFRKSHRDGIHQGQEGRCAPERLRTL